MYTAEKDNDWREILNLFITCEQFEAVPANPQSLDKNSFFWLYGTATVIQLS